MDASEVVAAYGAARNETDDPAWLLGGALANATGKETISG